MVQPLHIMSSLQCHIYTLISSAIGSTALSLNLFPIKQKHHLFNDVMTNFVYFRLPLSPRETSVLLLPTIRPMAYAAGGPITLSERSCMHEEMEERISEREREGGERGEGGSIQDERCSSFPSSWWIWQWLPLSQDHCH